VTPELDAAIRDIETLAGRRGRPTRHDARALLLALGGALEANLRADAEKAKGRIKALPADFLERWEQALRDELSMASTEYTRSVDPRYLDDPSYDFEYTIQARRRLGMRLSAAEFLGLPADETLVSGMRRADALLERHRPKWSKPTTFRAE